MLVKHRVWTVICWSLFLLFFISSCGKDFDEETREYVIQQVESGTPNYFLLEDSTCTAENSLQDLSEVQTWLYNGSTQTAAEFVDLGDSSAHDLSNRALAKTVFDGSIYLRSSGSLPLPSSHLRPLSLCQQRYARNSIESVAIAAAYSITKAWDYYFSLDKADPSLEKVLSVIHPELIQRTSEDIYLKDEIITDNSLWVYSPLQGGSMILSVAHSLERDRWYPIKFWERPSVFFHEFGHHIFHHHTFLASGFTGKKNNEKFFTAKNMALNAQDALNEGFADLFSHYTVIATLDPHYQWGCDNPRLGKCHRDIRYGYFQVGRELFPKRLSQKFLENFFSQSKKIWVSKEWQDPHLLGSVIAHALDQFMHHSLGDKSLNKREKAKIKTNLLIGWLDHIRKKSSFHSDSSMSEKEQAYEVLSQSILAAILSFREARNVKEGDDHHYKNDCYLLAKFFPVFYLDWIEEKKITCSYS